MRTSPLLLAAVVFPACMLHAQDLPPAGASPVSQDTTATSLAQVPEGAWLAVAGTVKVVGERSFILDHGDGSVAVAYGGEALRQHQFTVGQQATVHGRVNNDLFDRKVILARTVVIQGDQPNELLVVGEVDSVRTFTSSSVNGTQVHGRVSAIDGRTITLEDAEGRVMVDTRSLSYDPAKAEGHRRVEVGDMVTVLGVLNWKARTLKATAVNVVKYRQLQGEGQPVEGQLPAE
jgi:hypothetical protein